jgi:RNA polymerase sigma-70 factor, ECF subfamily
MARESPDKIARLITRAGQGDESSIEALMPEVYAELRALAGSFFKRERPEHTLQPTALVNEAFVRLAGTEELGWENRAHFFAIAARIMRRILTDHARSRKASKRGGGRKRVTLSGLLTPPTDEVPIDLLALDEAMTRLSDLFPRQGRIVEMRFLGGLDEKETAHVLGVTTRTVQREWRLAKAFLRVELRGGSRE